MKEIRFWHVALFCVIAIAIGCWLTGCQPVQNGGMELSPAGEAAVSVGSLYVPEPFRTIGLLLLGIAGGGTGGYQIGKKKKK